MNKVLGLLAIGVLVVAVWLTVSQHPITYKINSWQAAMMGDNKYFPALTICMLALPPLVILLAIKKMLLLKNKIPL